MMTKTKSKQSKIYTEFMNLVHWGIPISEAKRFLDLKYKNDSEVQTFPDRDLFQERPGMMIIDEASSVSEEIYQA